MTQGVLQMMGRAKLVTAGGWAAAALLVVAVATVPVVRGAADAGGAPAGGGGAAATGESAVVAAEREELAASQRVLTAIERQEQIVQLTDEFLFKKYDWTRRVAKLKLRLAKNLPERVQAAMDYLAAATEMRRRVQDRASVDADVVAIQQAEAYVAEAKTVVERAKAGEGGDLGM